MNVFTKQKQSHRCRKQACGSQGTGVEDELDWDWHAHTSTRERDRERAKGSLQSSGTLVNAV